ncbi:MAG: hypothetical protein WC378_16525 [Opitutaceae bacterium]
MRSSYHPRGPHILLIQWDDYGIEEILPALERWARNHAKKNRQDQRDSKRHRRPDDPMSDLWEIACYRLRTQEGLPHHAIADKLNRLPKFKHTHPSFDADGARKLFANAKAEIERPSGFESWLVVTM